MVEEFVPKFKSPTKISTPANWLIFYQDQLLVNNDESRGLPLGFDINEFGISSKRKHYLGTYQNRHYFAIEATHNQPQDDYSFLPLRECYRHLSEANFALACRAKQIIGWDKHNQFCSYCSSKLVFKDNERAKICLKCKMLNYPQLTPAIIVLIHNQDQILLARSKKFSGNMYSVLAGFIEPGESAEETLIREVQEEAGVTVKNIRYFGSQAWPFPNSFMIGFVAEYHSGNIRIDTNELIDAQWFHIDELPNLPLKGSIARHLIDHYVDQRQLLKKLHIRPLAVDEQPPWQLLLTDDPSRSNINEYLSHGRCCIALYQQAVIGEYVLLQKSKAEFELMNIAVAEHLQAVDIERELIQHACKQAKQGNAEHLWIGVSNSNTNRLQLFQQQGFVIDHILKGYYTTAYSKTVFENSIQCVDQFMLKKKL